MKFTYVATAVLLYILYATYYHPSGEFVENKFQLATGFTAKSYCSCLFVTENTEPECLDYAALDLISPKLSVDYEKKSTQSVFFFVISREAQYLGADKGCVLL